MRNILLCSLLFICITLVIALKEGDSCLANFEKVLGVCKNFTQCPYAVQLVKVHQKLPTHCAWNYNKDNEEVVCCPLNEYLYKTGQFRNSFGDTVDGKLRSQNMSCSYDGSLPVLCCEERQIKVKPEPRGCRPLTKPSKKINHIAWQKCVEFQRYYNVCELQKDNRSYERRLSCGMYSLADKISGGVKVSPKEFPHMALLGGRNMENFDGEIKWIAGGTLISEKFILTAAHVLTYPDGPVSYALLGALAKSTARDGVLHFVVRREQHPNWDPTSKYNDIALLELDSRVHFNEFITPACLALPEMTLSEDRVLAGWGETGGTSSASDVLMKTLVKEYNASRCAKEIDLQVLPKRWRAESMICAGAGHRSSNDSCHGDSGVPLMAYLDDLYCAYAVRGIVSWGSQCGQGYPGVYTNVHHFLDWIVEIVWKN